MIEPYSIDALLGQVVYYLDSNNQVATGSIVRFIHEENLWLISNGASLVKREYSEMGQVVGFFKRFGPDYQNPAYYQLVKNKFVLAGMAVPYNEPDFNGGDNEDNGLSIMDIIVLLNGTGVYMR